ncbi:hypothetical protein [Microbacterium panaciterrae]|uniref:Uncharacterized protein n=1 Tax=Microbacterium panaciterrae TaxID=985759 RepID=A0ABP8PP27_9MICO
MTQDADRDAAMRAEPSRRSARLRQPTPAVLPVAVPVTHSGTGSPTPRRRRALLILGLIAVVLLLGAAVATVVGVWNGSPEANPAAGYDLSTSASDSGDAPRSVNALLGEGGGSPTAPDLPTGATPTPVVPTAVPEGPHPADPTAPNGSSPAVPVTGGTLPAPGDAGAPSTPNAPSAPSGPSAPAAPSSPTTPPAAPAPAAPRPLAFTGLTQHSTIGLLGIRILSSDTLSLSGQPGSTASVSYDSTSVGSVTFDGAGRASLTVGGGLLDLGLGDPVIRVAYSDGTAGAPIQARRSAL